MGRQLGSKCIHNIWIPDGSKDLTVDRLLYRKNLKESLDQIFEYKTNDDYMLDSIECKLFGIGSESYVGWFARVLYGLRRCQQQNDYLGFWSLPSNRSDF